MPMLVLLCVLLPSHQDNASSESAGRRLVDDDASCACARTPHRTSVWGRLTEEQGQGLT
jgi:hypothetical protein